MKGWGLRIKLCVYTIVTSIPPIGGGEIVSPDRNPGPKPTDRLLTHLCFIVHAFGFLCCRAVGISVGVRVSVGIRVSVTVPHCVNIVSEYIRCRNPNHTDLVTFRIRVKG